MCGIFSIFSRDGEPIPPQVLTSCTDGQEITELFITAPEMLMERISST